MTEVRDYLNFSLLTDALLFADVFENFRDVFLQDYGLVPAHNYTTPGLPWQRAPKMTDVEVDLLTNIAQHLFIEEGIKRRVGNDQPRICSSQCPWHGKLRRQQTQ